MTATSMYDDFDRLTSKYVFTGTIRTLSQLHVGSGEKGETVDALVARVRIGERLVPYIPGSSLKGVLRSMASSLIAAKGETDVTDSISRLFGSQDIAAHVQVFDCLPVGWQEGKEDIHLQKKMGVAIDPVTGAARRGALFSVETIPPGTAFELRLIIENIPLETDPDDESVKILAFLINELKEGNVSIGGKTTSGLGRIILEDLVVTGLDMEKIKDLEFEYRPVTFP